MEAFQQRVVDEKKELDEKIAKLLAFSETETYDNLPEDEKSDLEEQFECMNNYSSVLERRISRF